MANGTENGDRENSDSPQNESGDPKNGAAKSALESADDLRALLSRAALSQSKYREFSAPARGSQPAQGDSAAAEVRAPNAEASE